MAATMTPTAGTSMFSFPTPTTQPGGVSSDWNTPTNTNATTTPTKVMENPLMNRNPPSYPSDNHNGNHGNSSIMMLSSSNSTSLPMTNHGGNERTRSPLNSILHNTDGLRRRKGGSAFASNGGFAPPPKATLSLQGHMLHEPSTIETENHLLNHASSTSNGQSVNGHHHSNDKSTFLHPATATLGSVATTATITVPNSTNSLSTTATGISPFELEDDAWVLVYGFSTSSQKEELLRLFDSFGRIINRHGGVTASSNWIAIQYQSQLEAEKALSHRPIELTGPVFCGVERLTPKKRQSLFQATVETTDYPAINGSATTTGSEPANNDRRPNGHGNPMLFTQMVPIAQGTATNGSNAKSRLPDSGGSSGGLQERDILLNGDESEETRRAGQKSICEELLGWWFGWD